MRAALRRGLRAATDKGPVVALLGGIAAVAGSYAAAGYTGSFVFTPMSEFVVQYTPGVIINTTLAVFGDLGQYINLSFALALTVGLFALVTGLGLGLGSRIGGPASGAAALVYLVAVALTGVPLLSLGAAIPAGGVVVLSTRPWERPDTVEAKRKRRWPDSDRRNVLQTGFGVAGFAGAAYLTGSYRTPELELSEVQTQNADSTASELVEEARTKAFDLPGSPALLSEPGDFYTVDIATVPPRVDTDSWTLQVEGEVDEELSISYDELTEMPAENRFSTLRCVGENLNAKKMDNAVWTGVPATELIDRAGADSEFVVMHAHDDFHNTIPMAAFEQSYIVYGMNGSELPTEHGHPVRVIVPGHWGEVNVKWLDRIEFSDEDVDGYWEERGWEGTGEVSAVAKLWAIEQQDNGVLLGGHAYDGHDGVAAVEISLDGGESWADAELTERLSVGDGWRQWRYEAAVEPGEYDVVVRAIDDDGETQQREPTDAFPDGATGWVSETVTVE